MVLCLWVLSAWSSRCYECSSAQVFSYGGSSHGISQCICTKYVLRHVWISFGGIDNSEGMPLHVFGKEVDVADVHGSMHFTCPCNITVGNDNFSFHQDQDTPNTRYTVYQRTCPMPSSFNNMTHA